MIAPSPIASLPRDLRWTPDIAASMAFAVLADDAGAPDIAAGVVDRLLQRHWRVAQHRIGRQREAAERRRPAQAVASPPKEAKTLLREAMEAALQADQAEESSRRLKEAGFQRQADEERDAALKARRTAADLERRARELVDDQAQARWSGAVLAEREALEASRGGEVVRIVSDVPDWIRDDHGALVRNEAGLPILGHDKATTRRVESSRGLWKALEKGHLAGAKTPPEQLWATGADYQDAYEIAARLVGTGVSGGEALSRSRRPNAGLSDGILQAFATLRRMRGQPPAYDAYGTVKSDHSLIPLSEFQIAVLDRVCGQDMTVRTAAGQLRKRHAAVVQALRDGLTLARDNLSRR